MANQYPPLAPNVYMGFLTWRTFLDKTVSYTVLSSDNGTLFSTYGAAGAVTFTLPKLAANYRFGFFNAVGQNLTITAPVAGTLIAFNNAAATNVGFQTGGQLIGGFIEIISRADAAAWLAIAHGPNTLTVS